MTAPLVVETELQVLEDQWRCLAQAVFPEDGRIADPDVRLVEHPFGEIRIAFTLGVDAGDGDPPIHFAAYMQDGPFECEQGERHLAARNTGPGKDRLHLLQRECRIPLAVGDHHVFQNQVGIEALPARLDAADGYRLADGRRDRLFDLRVIAADVGQDDEAQAEDQQRKDKPAAKQYTPGHAQGRAQQRRIEQRPQPAQPSIETPAQRQAGFRISHG